jgi:hypothetical protein
MQINLEKDPDNDSKSNHIVWWVVCYSDGPNILELDLSFLLFLA